MITPLQSHEGLACTVYEKKSIPSYESNTKTSCV